MKEDKLKNIKKKIESLNENYQYEILNIFKQNDIEMTKNRNGFFINLTKLDSNIINKLENHLIYIEEQENMFKKTENKKKMFKETFFNICNE